MLRCLIVKQVCFPQRVPISPSRLHIIDWLHVYEKSAKRLDVWHGSSLTMALRGVLIKSSLNNSAIYQMSIFLLIQTIIDKTEKIIFLVMMGEHQLIRRNIILSNGLNMQKYQERRSRRIKNLRKMNISLVSEWWWKLENEQGVWQDRAHANYIKDLCTGQIKHIHDDSPIWTDLLKIRHIYMNRKKFQVYNGKGPYLP